MYRLLKDRGKKRGVQVLWELDRPGEWWIYKSLDFPGPPPLSLNPWGG